MNKLQTLHLSGNLITGSLPTPLNISQELQDISLSHNLLSGSIALQIQEREWVNLDLSFNKFSGTLASTFASYPPTTSLRLLVNRLSGKIPTQLQHAKNLSILDGNLFECDLFHENEGLPRHDPATSTYQCANSFQQLSYLWVIPYVFFLFTLFMGLCLFTHWKTWWETVYSVAERIDKSLAILDHQQFFLHGRTSSLFLFKKFLIDWQVTCLFISFWNLFLILPVWVILTQSYNTYEHEYSWSASVAYLSGLVPSIVAVVMFSFLLTTVFSLTTTNTARHQSRRTSNFVSMKSPEPWSLKCFHYGTLGVILLVNCIIVIGVNVLYVLATNNFNKTIVSLCAMALALFSFAWNLIILSLFDELDRRIFLTKAITKSSADVIQRYQHRHLITQSIIGLFNNILIPLLSTAAVSSNCFYYFFQLPKPILATFQYSECLIQTSIVYACFVVESITACPDVVGSIYQCHEDENLLLVTKTITFSPPFLYSYQCSSTFISSYAAVYVYSYMMVAMVSPLLTFLLCKFRQSLSSSSSSPQLFVDSLLPPYLLPVDKNFVLGTKLFFRNFFITTAIIDTAVLITFGAIFPPLSFVICCAILIRAFSLLYSLGNLLLEADENSFPQYSQQLLQDCADIPEIFGKLLWLILPFAALIYSLFILDTYGDAVSWQRALIPTVTMCAVPILLILLRKIYSHSSVKPHVNEFFDWCSQCGKQTPLVNFFLIRHQELNLKATTIVTKAAFFSVHPPHLRSKPVPIAPDPVSQSSLPGPSVISLACSQVMPIDLPSESNKEDAQRPPLKVWNDLDIEEL
jgi:hypothetical protein